MTGLVVQRFDRFELFFDAIGLRRKVDRKIVGASVHCNFAIAGRVGAPVLQLFACLDVFVQAVRRRRHIGIKVVEASRRLRVVFSDPIDDLGKLDRAFSRLIDAVFLRRKVGWKIAFAHRANVCFEIGLGSGERWCRHECSDQNDTDHFYSLLALRAAWHVGNRGARDRQRGFVHPRAVGSRRRGYPPVSPAVADIFDFLSRRLLPARPAVFSIPVLLPSLTDPNRSRFNAHRPMCSIMEGEACKLL